MVNQDQEKWDGRDQQVGGQVKEKAGELTGDQDLENRGKADQAEGKGQGALAKAKDAVGDAADKVKDAVRKD